MLYLKKIGLKAPIICQNLGHRPGLYEYTENKEWPSIANSHENATIF